MSSLALFLQPVSCLWSQILETLILNTSSDVLTLAGSLDSEDAGLPQYSLHSSLQLISPPPRPQSSSSPARLTYSISPESPREWCAIETGWNMISKCLSDQKFSKKTFLKSCVHCRFSRPIRLDGTWGGAVASHCSRNSKQDLEQINEPQTGIPGAPGQWPPSFPRRDDQPTLWDPGPHYRLIRWDIS